MAYRSTEEIAPVRNWLWNVLAGVLLGLAALVVVPLLGIEISSELGNAQGQVTWLTLFGGVFAMGCLMWWMLVARPQHFATGRGAVAGALAAALSFPTVFLLADLLQRSGQGATDLGRLDERIVNALLLSLLSLLTYGFLTMITGALVGMGYKWLLIRFHGRIGAAAAAQYDDSRMGHFWRWVWRVALALVVVIFVLLVGAFAWLSLVPLDTAGLANVESTSVPAETYAEAIEAYRLVQEEEAALPLNERCLSTLLSHGEKVERVVIYVHGLTSCPAQFDEFGARLFAMGYNVYIPRMPGHGMADPMTLALADLTAEELITLTNRSVDIAQGLGDEVVLIGLSAGGTIASWASQYRADVDHAISISPFFGPYVVPPWATHAATNLLLKLPNAMVWWNPLETVRPAEMSYAYARYATHALAEVMRLGRIVDSSARVTPPLAANINMVLNDADVAVSNALATQVVESWRAHGTVVTTYTFPFSNRLPHDVIDPRQRGGNIELVYPIIIDLMNGELE